jgi:hypothetical protein
MRSESLDPKQTEVWIQALISHHLIPNQALSLSLLVIHGSEYQKKRELGMDPIHRVNFGAILVPNFTQFCTRKTANLLAQN